MCCRQSVSQWLYKKEKNTKPKVKKMYVDLIAVFIFFTFLPIEV